MNKLTEICDDVVVAFRRWGAAGACLRPRTFLRVGRGGGAPARPQAPLQARLHDRHAAADGFGIESRALCGLTIPVDGRIRAASTRSNCVGDNLV